MIQVVVTIYAAVKRGMKAFKWLVFLAAMVLMYYVSELGDYLKDDLFADNFAVAFLVLMLILVTFVIAFWASYYLLERLAGYRGSFSQFLHDKMPEPERIAKYTRYRKAKRAFNERAGQRPVVSPVPDVRVAILADSTRVTLRPGSVSQPARPTVQIDPPKGLAHPVVKTRF